MKISYIVNARIPTEKAHGVQIMKMCEAFKRLDVDIELVVPKRKGCNAQNAYNTYSIKTQFPIKYLPILETYEFGYLGFILGSLSFSISSFFYCLTRSRDTIFYSRDQDQFSFLTFFFWIRPYFFEVHGLKEKTFFHKMLFSKISGIVATNSYITEKLKSNFNLSDRKIIICPNGVDETNFEHIDMEFARKQCLLPLDKKIIIYAGHFYRWKGVNTLVRSSLYLPDDVQIYMIGGNDEEIERLRREEPESFNKIIFTKYRPFSEMPYWYAAAHALVITGTAKDRDSVHFTSPIKLFEYMATGRPIVAIDSPAIRDILDPKDVFFYKPDDEKDLAKMIIKSINTDTTIMCKNLISKAKEYTWHNRARKITDFIGDERL